MNKTKLWFLVTLACLALATPALAADGGDAGGGNWAIALAALGLGIAVAGGAIGQGRATGSACEGMARNPGAGGRIQAALLLGLAFMESLVIFAWVMTFLIRGG